MSCFPLADSFPGVASLPRVELVQAPTSVEDASTILPADEDLDIGGLWIKRDDLTSARYGGNKVRKLELLLGEALAEKRRAVITFGAYGSNHALATAVHASALGLEPWAVLSPQAPGPFAACTLRAHAGIGTRLIATEGWDGKRAAIEARRALIQRDGMAPTIIPMGGTSPLGAIGYVSAALELLGQGVAPDLVYVAGGTLGTAIGLAIGFAAAGALTKVSAIRVTPDEVAFDEFARTLAVETVDLLRSLDATFPALTYQDLAFELRHDWFEPGYGIVTPETTEAVALALEGGVKLETTYTGKAFAAMLSDARNGRIAGNQVLFWDTYNSGPMPPAGDDAVLPEVLRDYVDECDRLYPAVRS